jgi:hypothetical protein
MLTLLVLFEQIGRGGLQLGKARADSARRARRSSRCKAKVRATRLRAGTARELAVERRARSCTAWASAVPHSPALRWCTTLVHNAGALLQGDPAERLS